MTRKLIILSIILHIFQAILPSCPSEPIELSLKCPDECITIIADENKRCIKKVTDGEDCQHLDEEECYFNQQIEDPICAWGQNVTKDKEQTNDQINLICYQINIIDLCGMQYTSQKECLSSTTLKCQFNQACIKIEDEDITQCKPNLSYLACKYVSSQKCIWDILNSICTQMQDTELMNCEDAMNKMACESNYESIQCMWYENENDQEQSKCLQYKPTKCEGDDNRQPLKYVCEQLELECKWNDQINECKAAAINDKCIQLNQQIYLNEYACKQIKNDCMWMEEEQNRSKKCQFYDGKDEKCEDGKNKFSCIKSKQSCSYINKCVDFDPLKHYCDDNLSFSGCKQSLFPCGWYMSKLQCFWMGDSDDQYQCSHAANEVSCMLMNNKCQWNYEINDETDELQGRCMLKIKGNEQFWFGKDSTNGESNTKIDYEFRQQFAELKAKIEEDVMKDNEKNRQENNVNLDDSEDIDNEFGSFILKLQALIITILMS